MTNADFHRLLFLSGYILARLADGNWKLALFDVALGVGLMAVAHWFDETKYSPFRGG